MSNGINKVILVGRIGDEPRTRYMPSGSAITSVSVATNEIWKDKQTGEKQEKTEWHNVVFFGRLAEIAGEYLKKGSQVYIEGKLQTEKWVDKSGNDRYTTKIIANDLQMLGGRVEGTGNINQSGHGVANHGDQQAPPANSQDDAAFDDGIPF